MLSQIVRRMGKDAHMRRMRIALSGALVLSGLVVLTGCRNRVAEERDELWRQSQEMQQKLDQQEAELRALKEKERMAATTPPAPQPAPQPAAQPAPPPQPRPAPKPVEQVGGLETTEDITAGTVT